MKTELKSLEYSMTREEFGEHLAEAEATLDSVDENGRETYVFDFMGFSTVMGVYCPATETADLCFI